MPNCRGVAYTNKLSDCIDGSQDLDDWKMWNGLQWKSVKDFKLKNLCSK